jgi:vacuolar iron transporter family protein
MENSRKSDALSPEILRQIRRSQVNEVTEYHIYKHFSRVEKSTANKTVLNRIADEELEHYRFWMQYNDEVEPRWWEVKLYIFLAGLFGMVFALKLMERGESAAHRSYSKLSGIIPGVEKLAQDEINHEKSLVNMLTDMRLKSFGTWLTAMNLVLLSLTGILAILSVLPFDPVSGFTIIILAGIVVSLSDSLFTLLLKNPGRIKAEQLLRALKRFISGLSAGILAALPFLLMEHFIPAAAVSLAVLVVFSLTINFYGCVISDQKVFPRAMRVLLSMGILFTVVWAIGMLITYQAGI